MGPEALRVNEIANGEWERGERERETERQRPRERHDARGKKESEDKRTKSSEKQGEQYCLQKGRRGAHHHQDREDEDRLLGLVPCCDPPSRRRMEAEA